MIFTEEETKNITRMIEEVLITGCKDASLADCCTFLLVEPDKRIEGMLTVLAGMSCVYPRIMDIFAYEIAHMLKHSIKMRHEEKE